MIKLPNTVPIPAPDPAIPTVAAPAPINLAAASTSACWIAEVCSPRLAICGEGEDKTQNVMGETLFHDWITEEVQNYIRNDDLQVTNGYCLHDKCQVLSLLI